MNMMSCLTTSYLRRCFNPSTARQHYSTKAQARLRKVEDLPDGRRLEYHEQGDPKAVPIIYIHGTPGSSATLGILEDTIGKEMGGAGLPEGCRALTEHLQLERYCILGTSGSTGYTLACAKHLPRNKLAAVGLCAGMGPWEAGLKGQSLANRAAMQVWKYTPSIIRKFLEQTNTTLSRTSDFQKIEDMWRTDVAKWFKGADKAALGEQHAIDAAVRTFRQVYLHGTNAHMENMRLKTQSCGFDVGDVDYEGIRLWYGDREENTPVRMGRFMAERLRGSELRAYEGKSRNTIRGQESVREFVADLLSRAGLR